MQQPLKSHTRQGAATTVAAVSTCHRKTHMQPLLVAVELAVELAVTVAAAAAAAAVAAGTPSRSLLKGMLL